MTINKKSDVGLVKKKQKNASFQQLGDLFSQFQIKQGKGYISQEFQDFGYRLALELNDLKHKSLYMKLAKNEDRGLLERVLSFVSDSNAKNKGALFMWKLKQLKEQVEVVATKDEGG